MKYNLFDLLRQLEIRKGKVITNADVARRSGISRPTIQNIVNNNQARIDMSTVAKLLAFFEAEGMPITVGDLFSVEVHAQS